MRWLRMGFLSGFGIEAGQQNEESILFPLSSPVSDFLESDRD